MIYRKDHLNSNLEVFCSQRKITPFVLLKPPSTVVLNALPLKKHDKVGGLVFPALRT